MTIFLRRFKLLIAVPLILLLWWFWPRNHPKNTCDQLFASVHKHIVPNAFENREVSFVGVCASASSLEKEACSYYTIHRKKDSIMIGHKNALGEYFSRYVDFTTGADGIIRYHLGTDPSIILGYIYPLFYDDYALGHVECVDKDGFAEWKAWISVPMPLTHNARTHSVVSQGLQYFRRVGSQLGVDIHVGDFYGEPCWKPPVWNSGVVRNKTGN